MADTYSKELESAREAALKGGKAIRAIYDTNATRVEHKEDGSPLTQADLAANQAILEVLQRDFPEDAILTEEAADSPERLHAERLWVIDPLDGTKEFISRNGEFTVNVALVIEKRPVLGVIHIPVTGETYFASPAGAYVSQRNGATHRIAVSERDYYPDMVLVKSRSHAGPKIQAFMEQCGFIHTKSRGSSLKGCLVASAQADVYPRLGPTNEWDICAMDAIVHAAGGRMTDFEGRPMLFNQPNTLNSGFLVTNNQKHDDLLKRVQALTE